MRPVTGAGWTVAPGAAQNESPAAHSGSPPLPELESCRAELARLREAQAASREILALWLQHQK